MANDSLNKFQGALTRTTAAIGVKTSVFVGSAKLKTHIGTLKKDISTLIQELGSSVYEMWDRGVTDTEQVTQQCRVIKEKYENIEALEAEIEKLERQETEVLGVKTQQTDAAAEGTAAFVCSSCGAAYDSPVKFCRKCGTKMA